MGVKWVNRAQFFHKLESVVPGMAVTLAVANEASASEMVSIAKNLASFEDGTLQQSIRMSRGLRPTSFQVEAGGPTTTKLVRAGHDAEYDYALGVEFGTQNMRARPFFWPAYRVMRKKFKGRAARAINQAVKKAGF